MTTVNELKTILKAVSLPVSGNKYDLEKRLQNWVESAPLSEVREAAKKFDEVERYTFFSSRPIEGKDLKPGHTIKGLGDILQIYTDLADVDFFEPSQWTKEYRYESGKPTIYVRIHGVYGERIIQYHTHRTLDIMVESLIQND